MPVDPFIRSNFKSDSLTLPGSVVLWNVNPPNEPPAGISIEESIEKKFNSFTKGGIGAKKNHPGGAEMTLDSSRPKALPAFTRFNPLIPSSSSGFVTVSEYSKTPPPRSVAV